MADTMQAEVIIIGAGVAGLSAAHTLIHKGVKPVILEAEHRYGGRVHTVYLPDGDILECGATWLHSSTGNPLYDFAASRGLLAGAAGTSNFTAVSRPHDVDGVGSTHETKASDALNTAASGGGGEGASSAPADPWYDPAAPAQPVYMRPGGVCVPAHTVRETMETMRGILQRAHDMRGKVTDKPTATVREFIDSEWARLRPDASATENALMEMRALGECAYSGAPSLALLSLNDYGAYFEGDGENTPPPRGFMSIIDELARPVVEAGCIQHNKTVTEITWDSPDGLVHVSCADGSRWSARAVVCTVSLGVMKHWVKKGSVFRPPLPAPKAAAVTRMGFGRIEKVHVEYETWWWRDLPATHAAAVSGCAQRGDPAAATSEPVCAGMVFLWDAAHARQSVMGAEHRHCGTSIASSEVAPPFEGFEPWMASVFGAYEDRDPIVPGSPRLTFWFMEDSGAATDPEADEVATVPAMDDTALAAALGKIVDHFTQGSAAATSKVKRTPARRVIRSRWGHNPNTRGSYTYAAAVAVLDDFRTLAAPLRTGAGAALCFAGEATHEEFFSTTHGAFVTGQRAAAYLRDEVIPAIRV